MIPNQEAILGVASTGAYVNQCLGLIEKISRVPGFKTEDFEELVKRYSRAVRVDSATMGYQGFNHYSCVSINEEVCHGIPGERLTSSGDVVKIDVSFVRNGWYADSCISSIVGNADSLEQLEIVETARSVVLQSIFYSQDFIKFSDLTEFIREYAEGRGFQVVRDYGGHGIERSLHAWVIREEETIRPGMIFTVEPMITSGSYEVDEQEDGWTVKTRDGSLSAQFEHTVAVMPDNKFVSLTSPYREVQRSLEAYGVKFELKELYDADSDLRP